MYNWISLISKICITETQGLSYYNLQFPEVLVNIVIMTLFEYTNIQGLCLLDVKVNYVVHMTLQHINNGWVIGPIVVKHFYNLKKISNLIWWCKVYMYPVLFIVNLFLAASCILMRSVATMIWCNIGLSGGVIICMLVYILVHGYEWIGIAITTCTLCNACLRI